MAINKKNSVKTEEQAKEKATYTVDITKAFECKNGTIAVDMTVNGIAITGCYYKSGNKNGKEWSLIQFPQHKGSNGKYYNHCWFPISKELMADIERQIEVML